MTSNVRLLSWSPGLSKVALTKLIREAAGIPLDEAHELVNCLLEGKVVIVTVSSENGAHQLAETARALGVQAEYVGNEVTTRK